MHGGITDMIVGLQTHIEGWVPDEDLQFFYDRGVRMARISAMGVTAQEMIEHIDAVERHGMRPYVIIADENRMRLRPGRDYECRNEDDGDIAASTYRSILNRMANVALETGSRLWGPTYSNLDWDSTRWARQVKGTGWPRGLFGVSAHSYDPHENGMFGELEALAGGLPICISEFGYPSNGISEQQHAERIRHLWTIYQKYYAAILYQAYSGPNADESYGIKRYPGELGWKLAAYVFPGASTPPPPPPPPQEDDMASILMTIREDQLEPTGDGMFTIRYDGPAQWIHKIPGMDPEEQPKPEGPVTLSVQPNGELQTRPHGTQGEYEKGVRNGDLIIITSMGVSHSFIVG